jgi:hypothetical protein
MTVMSVRRFSVAIATMALVGAALIALFSGGTQGVTNDSCPKTFSVNNLGAQLIGAGLSFKGYSESMPSNCYTGCSSGTYMRKHNSWVDFSNVCNDMHDCSIGTGNSWLQSHLDGYAQLAKTHNSLLIVTFDEDNSLSLNHIHTTFVGANVKAGSYSEKITHYTVLRTLESAYGLSALGRAASVSPITDVWS